MATTDGTSAVTLHHVIDDEVLLEGFHSFAARFHAEETLMFWMSVEVFKHRNWKAAKFFGMDEKTDTSPEALNPSPKKTPATTPTRAKSLVLRRGSKATRDETAASEEAIEAAAKKRKDEAIKARALQRKLDEAAASRLGLTLEQLYLVKEADFIFDNFLQRGCPFWICVDQRVADKVEEKLKFPDRLDRNVFSEAQALAWAGMTEDLLPRFIKEILTAGQAGSIPLTSQVQLMRNRVEEIKGGPPRRKTGVATALAFSFRQRTVSRTEKQAKAATPQASKDPGKAAAMLRTYSSMAMLNADSNAVTSMGLSRNRLSQRSTTMDDTNAQQSQTSKRSTPPKGTPPPPPPSQDAGHTSRVSSTGTSDGVVQTVNSKASPLTAFVTSNLDGVDRHISMPVPVIGTQLRTSGKEFVRPRSKSDSIALHRHHHHHMGGVDRVRRTGMTFFVQAGSFKKSSVVTASKDGGGGDNDAVSVATTTSKVRSMRAGSE